MQEAMEDLRGVPLFWLGSDARTLNLSTICFNSGGIAFEWGEVKAARNKEKHGVTFPDAASIFVDEHAVKLKDEEHSGNEARSMMLGRALDRRVLAVACVERGERLRVISAREATKRERSTYDGTGRA